MRKKLGLPDPAPGFSNDKQPPAILPTQDPDSVVTLPIERSGMNDQSRANTNSIIQTHVLKKIARILNGTKNTGIGIPFTPNAIMTITVWNAVADQLLTFQCWYIESNTGLLKPVPNTGTPPEALENMDSITADRFANYQQVTLPSTGGIIVLFMARIGQMLNPTRRGQTLVKVEIDNYGTTNDQLTSASTDVLVSGYVYTNKDLTYPSVDSIQDPVSGDGFIQNVILDFAFTATGPENISIGVLQPSNNRVKPKTISVQLQTSSVPGDRNLLIQFLDDQSNLIYQTGVSPNIPANQNVTFIAAENYPSPVDAVFDSNGLCRASLPPILLLSGYEFTGAGFDLQNGDILTVVGIYQEEWLEPVT